MSVKSVSWIAQAVSSDGVGEAQRFAESLGMRVLSTTAEAVILATESGDVIEFCGPGHKVPDYLFRSHGAVCGFTVDDLCEARTALESAGFAPITDATEGAGVLFQHFYGPDSTVIALIESTPTSS